MAWFWLYTLEAMMLMNPESGKTSLFVNSFPEWLFMVLH